MFCAISWAGVAPAVASYYRTDVPDRWFVSDGHLEINATEQLAQSIANAALEDATTGPVAIAIGGPDTARTVDLLLRALDQLPHFDLNSLHVVFVGDPDASDAVRAHVESMKGHFHAVSPPWLCMLNVRP